MRSIWNFSLVFLAATSCRAECDSRIIQGERETLFIGCTSEQGVDELIERLKSSPTNTLVIQSEGGPVGPAMRLAQVLHQSPINLLIHGYCFSSCANYIIGSAKNVSVEQGASISFHGDARITCNERCKGNFPQAAKKAINRLISIESKISFKIKKIELLHNAQRIIRLPQREAIEIKLNGQRMLCTGFSTKIWSPALHVLKEMGLIDQIVVTDKRFETIAPTLREEGSPFFSSNNEINPFSSCSHIQTPN